MEGHRERYTEQKRTEILNAVFSHYEYWLDPHGPGIPLDKENITYIVDATIDALSENRRSSDPESSSTPPEQIEPTQGE